MADETRHTHGSGPAEGARRATGAGPEPFAAAGPLGPNQRWTVTRKREVALRLLRGEPMDALARELGVEIYRLEEWKNKALAGIDASLRERDGDPLEKELQSARSKIGELMMDNELLRERTRRPGPLAKGRLRN
ncbi:MAG: IS3 family transposase [Anaerolineae bacterium]|nr:IS3 family transposase [Anaerolineae bacterium]